MQRVLIIVVVCFFHFSAFSQDFLQVGVRGGLNYAWHSGYRNLITSDEYRVRYFDHRVLGPHFGITANYELTYFLSVQPEINFSSQGGGVRTSYHDDNLDAFDNTLMESHFFFRANYLQAPLLVKAMTGEENLGFFVNTGPYFGYWLSGRSRTLETDWVTGEQRWHTEKIEFEDNFRRLDIGWIVGIGFLRPIGKGDLFVEFRYNYGFSDLLKMDNVPREYQGISNRFATFSIGYFYPIGKMGWIKEKVKTFDEEELIF
ncbi:MAG: porin family protein [Cytophagaceae bacterium]